eukprot:GHRR01004569.1.p1 GENE.GHRR01004569.1~~GHRR01004569.1.p1  ORF type:complete len:718 (+),score=274.25 GHRR01004569.1:178-2331(+)
MMRSSGSGCCHRHGYTQLALGQRHAHRRLIRCRAAPGLNAASTAKELLQQLANGGFWDKLQPHFGSRFAGQLLNKANSGAKSVQLPAVHVPKLPSVQLPNIQVPSLPELPAIQLPAVQLPEMHLPAVQFPASLPSSPAAVQAAVGALSGAADAIAHLPSSIQQQMQLLQLQLQQPITTSNSTFEPHFGTKMLTALLQQVLHSFQDVLDASTAQLSAAAAASPINPASVSSSAIAVNDAVTAYFRTVLAFWQVLAAAAVHALPPGVNQTLSESWDTLQQQTTIATAVLQQQSIAATASLHQVHEHLVHMQLVLQQLPQRGFAGHSFLELSVVVAGTLVAIAASVPPEGAVSGGEDIIRDELTHEYNDAEVAAYFTRRPVLVAQRSLHIAAELTAFGASLFSDALSNKLQINQAQRAVQLRGVIERLGPAWVKVAQALSTRIDLLPPEYYKQVQLLQDRVPPFPCEQAKEVISNAFGRPVDEVFSYMSPKPVAAASLGQVYKGRLRPELGVGDVAVKVQRPDVLQQVCLDLHLMRRVAATISALPEVRIDWAALIDSWAVRFLHEMDYTREAANAKLFRQQMADAGVIGIVTADVLDDLSNDVVLTTTWVDGEKLSESRASDVRELCNTLLSAYLIQLLDTGLLHADPHPGNLLRTVDGRICVLDFGLMTEVTPEQRIALVEYIAHLTIQVVSVWRSEALTATRLMCKVPLYNFIVTIC